MRILLQFAVAVGSLVPLTAGLGGVLLGPAALFDGRQSVDLDSHFRYLSGLLLAIGLAFLTTVPSIEIKTARFRLLTALVFIGGLSRLVGLYTSGVPSLTMSGAFAMELVVTPLLCLWQGLVAKRYAWVQPK